MLPDRIDDEQVPLLDDPPPPPLAVAKDDGIEGAPVVVLAGDGVAEGDDYGRALSQDAARKLGVTSTMLLILNKMIGTGIFSIPSGVYAATGNVGVSILLWLVGGCITMCSLSAYLELGLAIPRSGGDKNYLERIYRHPKYLATCVFMAQMVLLGFTSGNCYAFGRYVLFAVGSREPDNWAARFLGVGAVTFAVSIHSLLPKWGMRLSNVLGIFKVLVLVVTVLSGAAALAGHLHIDRPDNLDRLFEQRDFGGGAYNYATALLRIIYSYKGWENANYVLGEVRNPQRTLAIAGPLAVGSITILYTLASISYFAGVSESDMRQSGVIVAGIFFRNVFGPTAGGHILPGIVALSNIGSVLAAVFTQGRVNQEFARSGLLPGSSHFPFFSSSPTPGLLLHWVVTTVVILAPPPGEIYEFIADLYTYGPAVIYVFVAAGLLYLQWNQKENWKSPWHCPTPATAVFGLANLFLVVFPFVPPRGELPGYPYYVFPVTCLAVLSLGAVYWIAWAKVAPAIGRYALVEELRVERGIEVVRFRKVALE